MPVFTHQQALPVNAKEAYAWCARPGALQRLIPPFVPANLLHATPGLHKGARATVQLGIWPFQINWQACHEAPTPPRLFIDTQVSGPFRRWRHQHHFIDQPNGSCVMKDEVDWEIPLGALGRVVAQGLVEKELQRVFAWRGALMVSDLQRHAPFARQAPLRIGITGASGLIGSALCAMLQAGGHRVFPIVRSTPKADQLGWNTTAGIYPPALLQTLDAVVHLAGENIAQGRWSAARKQAIYDSRVQSTQAISQSLVQAWAGEAQHKHFLCASAIGFYGQSANTAMDETSQPGSGFLSEVVQAWEQASQPAADAGIRVVTLRLGVVLSAKGGALKKMLPPFYLGLGGALGNGKQWLSWIGLEDVLGAILFCLHTPSIQGPTNLTTPNPLTMGDFAKHLGKVLHRPARLNIPAWVLRLALGEMATPLLLTSQRVLPTLLTQQGFAFIHPQLPTALQFALGKL